MRRWVFMTSSYVYALRVKHCKSASAVLAIDLVTGSEIGRDGEGV